MSYIKDMVNPGEKILLKAEISKLAFINAILLSHSLYNHYSQRFTA